MLVRPPLLLLRTAAEDRHAVAGKFVEIPLRFAVAKGMKHRSDLAFLWLRQEVVFEEWAVWSFGGRPGECYGTNGDDGGARPGRESENDCLATRAALADQGPYDVFLRHVGCLGDIAHLQWGAASGEDFPASVPDLRVRVGLGVRPGRKLCR